MPCWNAAPGGTCPRLAEAHYQRAAALHELGRTAEAEPAVARALVLQPDHIKAVFLHGLVLGDLSAERFEDAKRRPMTACWRAIPAMSRR